MLTEYTSSTRHYYKDELGRFQGEAKEWYRGGQLCDRCLFKDGQPHGEYKWWDDEGTLVSHHFYQDYEDITNQVKALVNDINNITQEERMIIKLKFGIECLS